MMKSTLKLIIILIFFPSICLTQPSEGNFNDDKIEQIFDYSDQTSFSESQIEYIEFRKNNKLNLLDATINELTQFPNFDIIIANKILEFVNSNPNTTIAKLSKELDLSGNQIVILEYCTIINHVEMPMKYEFYTRNKYNYTTDNIYGFEKNKFQGNALDYTSKNNISLNNYNLGIIFDKDAGETNNVDFISGNLSYFGNNLKVLIGDFYYEVGMGNLLWREFPENKSADVISPALKFGNGLRQYRSTMDNSLFRGGAVDYFFNLNDYKFKFGTFYSSINRSGTLDTSNNIITSVYNTGLYRTETEISKKNNFRENSFSGNLSIEKDKFTIGFAALYLNYQYPIESSSSSVFFGKKGLLKSIFGKYLAEDFSLGYDLSFDAYDHLGLKIGSVLELGMWNLSAHFRYFSQNNRSPYGSLFGEFSYPSNETGLYVGAEFKGIKGVHLYNYIDLFKSNGPTYYIDEPVNGFALFNQTEIKISKKLNYSTRIKFDNKTDELSFGSTDSIFRKSRFYWRNEIQYDASRSIKTRLRLESSFIDFQKLKPVEIGLAGFFEVHYEIKHLDVFSRISIFSTPSYESAIWQYEYFIPGVLLTFPAYLDGSKYILGAKFDILNFINLQLLYTTAIKNNIEYLSSSNDKIMSNSTNNLILQMELILK